MIIFRSNRPNYRQCVRMYMQTIRYLMWKKWYNCFKKVVITCVRMVVKSCWLLKLKLWLKLVVWGLTLLTTTQVFSFLGKFSWFFPEYGLFRSISSLFGNACCSLQTSESHEMVTSKMVQTLNSRKKHSCSRHTSTHML